MRSPANAATSLHGTVHKRKGKGKKEEDQGGERKKQFGLDSPGVPNHIRRAVQDKKRKKESHMIAHTSI